MHVFWPTSSSARNQITYKGNPITASRYHPGVEGIRSWAQKTKDDSLLTFLRRWIDENELHHDGKSGQGDCMVNGIFSCNFFVQIYLKVFFFKKN